MKLAAIALFLPHGCLGLSTTKFARAWLRADNAVEVATWYETQFALDTTVEGDEAEVSFGSSDFSLRLSPSAPSKPYESSAGILGIGLELPQAAVENLGDVVELKVAASLIPDEDPTKTATLRFAQVHDPAGYPVFGIVGDVADTPAPKLVLTVSDLDQSIEFYTRCLGLRLLRKRSLVPDLAAMVGILGDTDADDATLTRSPEGATPDAKPRIELRYIYSNDNVEADVGLAELQIQCADPEAQAALADVYGGTLADEDNLLVTDPDGYLIRLLPL